MSYISGARATEVEYQFAATKKAILADAGHGEVSAQIDTLVTMLREDANVLDGESSSTPWASFLGSLGIILREGIEAIVVVAAIIAYLVKSGHRDKVRTVGWGVAAALVASVGMAVLISSLTSLQGASQEVIEGATMLVAIAMLIYVSNWVLSRSEHEAWMAYISRTTDRSLSRGSVLSLAFVAFLAVFREGAETILFYTALLAGPSADPRMIWVGLGVGLVLLVGVYLLINRLAVRVPLRPFFLVTSALLAAMAFVFTGNAIKEFQEGGVVSVTPLAGLRSVDWLGVYPTAETLAAQGAVLAVLVALALVQVRRTRRRQIGRASCRERV
jgi:high-affinity iron transporter